MAVSKRTAHEFLEAMSSKNVEALIEACKKVSIECEEIWCYVDYHNKDNIYTPWNLTNQQKTTKGVKNVDKL